MKASQEKTRNRPSACRTREGKPKERLHDAIPNDRGEDDFIQDIWLTLVTFVGLCGDFPYFD